MEFLILYFGITLTVVGSGFLVVGLVLSYQSNYKPRYTRSTYLPHKR
jgi:hypothetical protein